MASLCEGGNEPPGSLKPVNGGGGHSVEGDLDDSGKGGGADDDNGGNDDKCDDGDGEDVCCGDGSGDDSKDSGGDDGVGI
ncbi:hypothetical protein ANN_09348 [Periplaneta americana]|uniref:Uncharacterized protein n=1 Tax=Periplaneta americana TaxID=6978 RepID=A0ABQ8TL36_PERAM|nr:hypothetical protein ANN_09348 [Periplaneta americana]